MLYCNVCIQDLILGLWFKPKPTASVLRALTPIPGPLIALACAALKCALDEWATGEFIKIPFTESDYRRTYVQHRALWRSFEDGNYKNRCHIIATDITNYCLKMSGIRTGRRGNVAEEEEEVLRNILENGTEFDLGEEDDALPPGY